MVRKNIQYPLIVIVLIFVGLIYFLFSPSQYELFPKCIFKDVTGLSCPGCGSQRATHELLHFNFAKAFYYNALFVVSLPIALLILFFYYSPLRKKFPNAAQFVFSFRGILVALTVIVLFFIIRNL